MAIGRDATRIGPVLAALVLASAAAQGEVSSDAFHVEIAAGAASGSFIIPCASCFWDEETDSFYWGIHDAYEPILDDVTGEVLAILTDVSAHAALGVTWYTKIDVSLEMSNRLASITIRSPLLEFPTIPDEYSQGRATMTLTVTDLGCDSAWAAGVGAPGTGMFHAYYDGVEFSDLLAQVYAGNCATATGGQNDPPVGYRDIPAAVSNIETEFTFLATPNDFIEFSGAFRLPAPPAPCDGDLDGDRDVDSQDMALMLNSYGACEGASEYVGQADIDQSGCVDLPDVSSMLSAYGSACD